MLNSQGTRTISSLQKVGSNFFKRTYRGVDAEASAMKVHTVAYSLDTFSLVSEERLNKRCGRTSKLHMVGVL